MHRQEQLKNLVKGWLDLELDETCSYLDTFTSIKIERESKMIVLNKKYRGNINEIGRIELDADSNFVRLISVASTPIMGLILFGLEAAIEQN